ncbi:MULTISPECIES: DivIVA domain-containing protein [Deinococcus]|uniref:DivIVA domain-containing protein n=1 Tax=Deinococcus TaxID=1298 RepID=UPI0009D66B7B|nr:MULTISPECIES: DivIVA domain-containing protein [Deinococcus]MDK2010776.1 DivIVA domain-containing protein [Deinococcus sp. 43]GGB49593.1 minicell-associated protein DivIVA [Deinococcus soli (ex Cha et al. 2016)]
MKFTPLDVRHQEFPNRMGGYERSSVRAFLNDLADDLETQLQQHQLTLERVAMLEKELEAQRQNEDEIRRAVIAAERISHELRENAAREAELMVAQATTERDGLLRESESRRAELESGHQARLSALEAAFRGRFADLERDHHTLTLERERAQAERLAELERSFSERHADLNARLTAARQEYAQFLSGYRALVASFAELSARHAVPEEVGLPSARLTVTPAHEQPVPGPSANDPAVRAAQPEPGSSEASPPERLAGHALVISSPVPAEPEERPLRLEAQQFL